MKIDAATDRGADAPFPLHERALERHASWARQFAAIGDIDSALTALVDLGAVAAELRLDRQDDAGAS